MSKNSLEMSAECCICYTHKLVDDGEFNIIDQFFCNKCMEIKHG